MINHLSFCNAVYYDHEGVDEPGNTKEPSTVCVDQRQVQYPEWHHLFMEINRFEKHQDFNWLGYRPTDRL